MIMDTTEEEHGGVYSIRWTAGDIQSLRPDWTELECEQWLERNWRYIQDRSIEVGWEVIENLLPLKGGKP